MKRRNVLQSIGMSVGASIILPATILQSCQSDDYKPRLFTLKQIGLFDEIGDTIIPDTEDSRGAKSISIGKFIDHYISDCYSSKDQKLIIDGLVSFKERCISQYGKEFIKLDQKSRHQCLVSIDGEVIDNGDSLYFKKLKDLVLLGYFTSQEGSTKALNYLPVPRKYDGQIALADNQKAWAL